ncbi:MAG: DUF1203 domain-containing protein [bacterium]
MFMQIAPLPMAFLNRVRKLGLDDQNQPVRRFHSVQGGEPCRDVLRRARAGEEVILASFCPFTKSGPFKEFGPIYILANPAAEQVVRDALPLPKGHPEDYFGQQFVLRAYNQNEDIIDGALVAAEDAKAKLEHFLQTPEVTFVQARFPVYGCFSCRIERVV